MKTVTEFSGSTLKSAAAAKAKLVGEGVAPEQMAERLGADVNITGDRLARLMEALEAAGDQVERVRLMRVFAATDEPKGAKKIGEFNYLIDLQPSAAPGGGRDRDRGRGGGRDRARGGGGGGLGGVPGAGGGAKGGHGPIGRDGLPKEDRGALQTAGAGWTLTRDPSAPLHDKRRGKPGGPKRGKPGDRRGPGGPGGDRRGPGGPRGPGAPGADARGPRGPRRDHPQGPRPPRPPGAPGQPGGPGMRPQGPPRAPGQPGAPGVEAGAPGPAGEGRRRRRRGGRGRGGPFALQPSTAPGAAAALGIPTASTTGIDPNAPQTPPGPPGLPGQKRRRRRGGRGRGAGGQGPQGARPEGARPEGAPPEGLAASPTTGIPGEQAQQRAPELPGAPRHNVPQEPNGNVRPPEASRPISADEAAPEPGNER